MKCLIVVALAVFVQSSVAERFYGNGYNDNNFDESTGVWTEWLDRDKPEGTAEYEDVIEQEARDESLNECKMLCHTPIAMEVKPQDPSHDWDEINTCTKNQQLNATLGYLCENRYQYDTDDLPQICFDSYCDNNDLNRMTKRSPNEKCGKCPDVTVRYFCVGNKADLEAEACSAAQSRSLDRADFEKNYKRELIAEEEKKREQAKKSSSSLAKLLRQMIKELD